MATVTNECIPYKEPGGRVTGRASAAVTGKRFVQPSAVANADGTYPVAHSGAGDPALGVSGWDAAIDASVPVIRGSRTILPVEAGAVVAVGAEVESDATGRAVTLSTGKALGLALSAAGEAGDDLVVDLY